MQLFLELRKYFKILGIEPNKKHLFSTENVIELILFVYCFGAMVTFLLFEPNKTFFDLGNTFYGAVCMALNIVTLLSNVIKQAKIFGLIKNIEEIIKNRLNHRLFKYNEINKKNEKWTRIAYTAFIKITYPFMYLPKLFLSYYSFFTGRDGSDVFVLNIPMSSPFNWKTPFGYSFAFSIQFIACFLILVNCTCILSFLSGVCWFLTSFVDDIEYNVDSLKKIKDNRLAQKRKFIDIIIFHSNIKQCVYDFSDIFDVIITGYYLWSTLTICSTLLVIHVEMSNNGSLVDIVFASLLMFWSFTQMLIFCDLGEQMGARFGQIDNFLYCSDWYIFPKDIQRILPTVMMAAQQPVVIQGFANLKCTREAFKKVIQGGFSYFMTLQQFAH